jgi:preprotein translocase subunit SecB
MKDTLSKPKKAAFSFQSYKVSSIILNEPPAQEEIISVQFNPSGKYFLQEGRYILQLDFIASTEEKENKFLSISLESVFIFDEKNIEAKQLPIYFYRNCIAIVFPYMRAIVSTITSVTNSRPLLLPLLNLSSLEEPLKKNTEEIK